MIVVKWCNDNTYIKKGYFETSAEGWQNLSQARVFDSKSSATDFAHNFGYRIGYDCYVADIHPLNFEEN